LLGSFFIYREARMRRKARLHQGQSSAGATRGSARGVTAWVGGSSALFGSRAV
jgi:hypothetical protein